MVRIFLLLSIAVFPFALSAQMDTLSLSMQEVITLSRSESPNALLAETRYQNAYWNFQSYKADLRPQIDLLGTLPDLNRTIDVITLPDGTDAFLNRSLMRTNARISLSQNIGLTGGRISAGTGLQRIDIFSPTAASSYLSDVFSISLDQPIFQFNPLKWQKRLEPLRYQEAIQQYSEDFAELELQTVQLFFDCYLAQLEMKAAEQERAAADSLYALAQGRFDVGRIAETELLQIELRVKRADARIAAATVDLQRSTEALRDFIGIDRQVFFDLRTPEELPQFMVNLENALEFAFKNRTEATSFLRRVEEAKRELDRAEKSAGFNMNINANFGLSNTGPQLNDVYANLLDQERLAVSFQLPLADWGKAESRREIARSNLELVQRNVDLDRVSFERQITLRVQQFELIRDQVALARRAYEVAQKTFTITQQRYYIGKIGIVDLNLANNEQESARQSYVNALANFWSAYYELRLLTLYDFVNDRPLIKNPE